MTWWQWFALGLILVALEVAASGGFYVLFFGIAAVAIAGLRFVDLAEPAWVQLLLFSLIAVASLLIFRQRLLATWQGPSMASKVDSLVGETAITLEAIPAGAVGRVELHGTAWTARNGTGAAIEKGRRCTVTRTEQLMLFIKPEEAVS